MSRSLSRMQIGILMLLIILFIAPALGAEDDGKISWGIHALAGGRYDNMRMCVGSPAGVDGGPIMDVYFDVRIPITARGRLAISIPVMRPLLFGIAFKMLQFEPQVTWEQRFEGNSLVLGAGLGGIFHYGPDVDSDPEAPGPSFFASGPLATLSLGYELHGRKGGTWIPCAKTFASVLFASGRSPGIVAGGALEVHYIPAGKKR